MEDGKFCVGVMVGIALMLLVLLLLADCEEQNVREPNEEACILGGYAIWETVGAEENGLCLGVVDGVWQVKLLDDVRVRMGGR